MRRASASTDTGTCGAATCRSRSSISPYRATVAPLANYIEALHWQRPDITLTVIVPEIIPAHRWESILHGRIAQRLRRILIRHEGIVVTSIPFHLKDDDA